MNQDKSKSKSKSNNKNKSNLNKSGGRKKKTVEDLMVEPVTIDKNDYLSHALDLMDKNEASWIIVTSNKSSKGVLSYRELADELGSVKKMDLPASALHVATAYRKTSTLKPQHPAKKAINQLIQENLGMLPVQSRQGKKPVGMFGGNQILKLPLNNGNREVKTLMEKNPVTVKADDRLVHARNQMLKKDQWKLPVKENNQLIGIITETDVAKAMQKLRKLVPGDQQNTRVRRILVEDIMTTNPITCQKNTAIKQTKNTLIENNIGSLPVLNKNNQLTGLITRENIYPHLKTNH